MKKSVIILAVAVLLLSVNLSQAKNNSNNKPEVPSETVSQKGEKATILLDKTTFLENIWNYEESPKEWKYKGDKPALIDFYADWCGPCRKAAPVLEKIAKEYEGKINVYKIDTEKQRELAAVFQVKGIPAFLYIPMEGKPTMTSGIGRSDEETKKRFEEIILKVLKVAKEEEITEGV